MQAGTRPCTEPRTFPPLVRGHSSHRQEVVSQQGAPHPSPQRSALWSSPSLLPRRLPPWEAPSPHSWSGLLTLLVSARTSPPRPAGSGASSGRPLCPRCPPSQVSSPSRLCVFPRLGCLLNWESPRTATAGLSVMHVPQGRWGRTWLRASSESPGSLSRAVGIRHMRSEAQGE